MTAILLCGEFSGYGAMGRSKMVWVIVLGPSSAFRSLVGRRLTNFTKERRNKRLGGEISFGGHEL
jgi:hypothetical protein